MNVKTMDFSLALEGVSVMELNKPKYEIALSVPGLVLLLLLNLPDVIWILHPAENDVLISKPAFLPLDILAIIFVICFNALICIIANRSVEPFSFKSPYIIMIVFLMIGYYVLWGLYYNLVRGPALVFGMDLLPCLICGLFVIDRKNYAALPPLLLFTIGHLVASLANIVIQSIL